MKLHPDSPELTAYVLRELGPAESTAVELAMAADPLLAVEVEAIRSAVGAASRAYADEPAPELSAEQRKRIARAATGAMPMHVSDAADRESRGSWWRGWIDWHRGMGIALAGAAALAVTLALLPRRSANPAATFAELRYLHPDGAGLRRTPTNGVSRKDGEVVAKALGRAATNSGGSLASMGRRDAPATRPESEKRLLAIQPTAPKAPAPARPAPAAVAPEALAARQIQKYPVTDSRSTGPASGGRINEGLSVARKQAVPAPVALESRNVATLDTAGAAGRMAEPPADAGPSGGFAASGGSAVAGQEFYYPGAAIDKNAGRWGMDGRLDGFDRAKPGWETRPAGDSYRPFVENRFEAVAVAPLSTFGLDVDTASYANVRRFLREVSLPPRDAVRIEELVNYFHYEMPPVRGEHPVAATVEVTECPWKPGNRLARVTVKAREVARAERPPANLVFLVDVSGSMEPENRLPLVQRTLRLLVDRLNAGDRVGIVTYAGNAAVALPPCSGADKASILAAIDRLRAGGSTHGSDGIRTAYAMARANRSGDAVNRVILCTDGDFNVGQTSDEDLLALVRGEAKSGVFLTVLGYGMDNYRDRTMQLLADNGNGTHAYIDSFREAQKVMATELESTLVTVAKDAKLQIEFNPERVSQWRLIGYEKRVLADRDFNDDTKDAGDLGAGHAVTALYELVPASVGSPGVDPLRYGATPAANPTGPSRHPDELMDVKLRYKEPDSETSRLVRFAVKDGVRDGSRAGVEMRFASAVAGFGMLLRNSPDKGQLTYDLVLQLAEQGIGEDRDGYRGEFIDLVRRAKSLSGK